MRAGERENARANSGAIEGSTTAAQDTNAWTRVVATMTPAMLAAARVSV